MSGLTDADIMEALRSGDEYPGVVRPQIEPGAQGSVEWLMQRLGHATCSRFKDVMNFTATGKESVKRAGYRKEVVIERLTNRPLDHYVSGPMRDGTEREPMAKMAYEARTGRMLDDCGFRKHSSLQWVGGSPDALIGDSGGLECKCPTPTTHLDTLLNGMDEEHVPQIQGLIWIFDAQWWDFCSYCPTFEEPLRTYVQRIPRDDKYISELSEGVTKFLAEVALQVAALRKIAESVIERQKAAA